MNTVPSPTSPVRGVSLRYQPLFSVRITHDYYNMSAGQCPDFRIVPTPDCADLMRTLGMIFRDSGSGFSVAIDQAALPRLRAWTGVDSAAPAGSQGRWSRLTFLLVPENPGFIGITQLPITTSATRQNLHAWNGATIAGDQGQMLGDAKGFGAAALYPVTGTSMAVTAPAGSTVALVDLSGQPVPVAVDNSNGTTCFALSGLPYGRYSVASDNAAAFTATCLYVPDRPPVSLCLCDLLLTQPAADIGIPAAFPLAADGTVTPVALTLPFRSRDTFWRYYVVPQGRSGQFAPDLQITGPATSFVKTVEQLPNGDSAVLFSATKPLSMHQRSPYRFSLSGQRQGANGSRDEISVDWLPAPPATPVWPVKSGDPLTGASEIYVYV
ncbi:hypothetical protein [Sphingomonas sp. 28-63-12]|uniref:hypothetical protein n=1 Tax=Sphingomonas sp. 28-63-12 TaxID=1970434 RepID=UPI000BD1EFAE|nr:MAG: hypothetical protein B7Y47_05850 [Sphingomonas sp. 28-63-12]